MHHKNNEPKKGGKQSGAGETVPSVGRLYGNHEGGPEFGSRELVESCAH